MSEIRELHVAEWLDEQNDRLSVHDGWIYRSYIPCSSNSQFQFASAVSSMCHVPDPTAPHVLAWLLAELETEFALPEDLLEDTSFAYRMANAGAAYESALIAVFDVELDSVTEQDSHDELASAQYSQLKQTIRRVKALQKRMAQRVGE